MADISKITLPGGDTYDFKDARISGVYPVVGTQTATTESWAGAIDLPALFNGLTIAYFLPRTSRANATLNLTLKGGGTSGAIPVYFSGSTRMGTQIAAGSTVLLTFWASGSISINGTATAEDRWTRADYYVANSDHYTTAWSNTASGTAAKTARCSGFALKNPCYLPVLFQYSNSAQSAITLNVESTGAVPVYINGEPTSASNNDLPAGAYLAFYNGTFWNIRSDDILPGIVNTSMSMLRNGGRPTDANFDLSVFPYKSRLSLELATSAMTSGKPPEDAHILTFGWDAGDYGAQMAIGHSSTNGARLYTRSAPGNSAWASEWTGIYDEKNPPTPAEIGATPASSFITTVAELLALITDMEIRETRFIMVNQVQKFTASKISGTVRGYITKTDGTQSDIMGVNALSGFVNIRVLNSDASFLSCYRAPMTLL